MRTRFDAFMMAVGLLAAGVLAVVYLTPVIRTARAASVSVTIDPPPAAAAAAEDPIVGQWLLEGRSKLIFTADHTIKGERHGFWYYSCTTDGGRNYELHWQHKGWVDYLMLYDDAQRMGGKTRDNRPISYTRP